MKMKITIIRTCPLCGEEHEIEVGIKQYFKWKDGLLVQDAFPDLSPEEREILISGICSSCQDDIFGDAYDEKEKGLGIRGEEEKE